MEQTSTAEVSIGVAETSSLREVYLGRLERLLRLRRQHEQDLNGRGIRLIDHSIFAAYCDCRHAGVEPEAHRLLREVQFIIGRSGEVPQGLAEERRSQGALQPQPEA